MQFRISVSFYSHSCYFKIFFINFLIYFTITSHATLCLLWRDNGITQMSGSVRIGDLLGGRGGGGRGGQNSCVVTVMCGDLFALQKCQNSSTRKSSCGKLQEKYHLRHNLSKHILFLGGGGVLPWLGGGAYLEVPPCPDLAREEGTYLGWGYLPWGTLSPHPDLAGRGVSTLDRGVTYLGQGGGAPTLTWVPPPSRCGHL